VSVGVSVMRWSVVVVVWRVAARIMFDVGAMLRCAMWVARVLVPGCVLLWR
jgi:hypothetical protein